MPAEWEPHEATWLGWPHNASDWPGKIAAIHFVYADIVKKITLGEKTRIIVNDAVHEDKARGYLTKTGVDLSKIEFFRVPTDRGWTRDFGPIFVRTVGVNGRPVSQEIAIAGFKFNAWAKYDDYKKDTDVAEKLSKKLKKEYLPVIHNGREFVLEGGAIDVNGRGTLLTTEECLLDEKIQVRNPGVLRKEYEKVLRESLGATNVLWLNKGIAGDDTHGHVDDLCRFVNESTVVLRREDDPNDANYHLLEENRERLEDFKLENGSRI
ncbi:MAG: agmatine deiminase family protein, partial [Acidobacteria bacterium]|nr:agmatine deiminase family protein [Acidobacteriota bacterium]